MRTADQDRAAFNWITTAEFGRRIGGEKPASASHVRRLIHAGKIRPDMVMVLNPGSLRADYRINPAAVEAFRRDHSLAAAA